MTLPWFRVDTGIGSHDKILALLDDPAPPGIRYRSAWSYVVAIGWSADNGTDGRVPRNALPFVHGTTSTARLLVKYGLWHERLTGWEIHNFAHRQPLTHTLETQRDAQREGGTRGACKRWHGDDCWVEGKGCTRDPKPPTPWVHR